MCGIVGFSGFNNDVLLKGMNNLLTHRGPDDSGEFIDRETKVNLAMRRLSIIDISGGHQPMHNEDKTIWIVFNGEIYNFKELKDRLAAKGHKFLSDHSDTEVLVHLYEEKGTDMLSQLSGMFSFVLYDKKKNILFGARDRVGIKPLYYIKKEKYFLFASELKSLLLFQGISQDIDFQSLYHYLSLQYIPSPRTIFKSVKKLPASCCFLYDLSAKEFKVKKYWNLIQENKTKKYSRDFLRDKIEKSIETWSVSDVPVACSLSGGIDSSVVTGLMAKSAKYDFSTFSLGFTDNKKDLYDERELARITAKKWGLKHNEIILRPDDLLKELDQMVFALDEPYAGGLPSWYVFKAMKGKVKVALTGTGGDELFGLYGNWRPYSSLFWKTREIAKLAILDNFSANTFKMLKKYPQGYLYHRYFTETMKKNIFNKNIDQKVIPTEDYLQKLWEESKAQDSKDKVAQIHFQTQLPEEFLHMTDRFSMAHSIEARTPLLDHRLIEAVMQIAPAIRTKSNKLKYLFIDATEDILDKRVISSPKKGFVLPLNRWLRGPLKGEVDHYLGASYLKKQSIFNDKIYSKVIKPFFKGKKYLDDYVWTLFMFQKWHECYIGS